MLDAKQPNGNCWGVLSVEKDDQISILSYPQHFKRNLKDKSLLNFSISEIGQRELIDREMFQLNVSLSHIAYESHANAYSIGIFIYYDSNFFDLISLKFENSTEGFRALPSRKQTSQGLIHIQTDEFRLLNSHFASIQFKTTIPKAIAKGDRCKGAIIVDFTYTDNLHRYNGKVHTMVNKLTPYQCKIDGAKDTSLKPIRLNVPQLSMLYDEVNREFFFCFQRKSYATQHASYCYRQETGSNVWHTIYHITSLMGIDVTTRELYGVDRLAATYVYSAHPFNEGFQIEDSQWAKADGNSNVRKSVVVNDVSSLTWNPSEGVMVSISSQQIWSAAKSGLWKNSGGKWNRIIMF